MVYVSAFAAADFRWFAVRIPSDEDEPASVIRSLLCVEDVVEFFGGDEVEFLPLLDEPGLILMYPASRQGKVENRYAGVDYGSVNMRATMVLDYYRSLYGVAGGAEEFSVLCGPVLLSGVTARGSFASIDGEELTKVLHLLHPVG